MPVRSMRKDGTRVCKNTTMVKCIEKEDKFDIDHDSFLEKTAELLATFCYHEPLTLNYDRIQHKIKKDVHDSTYRCAVHEEWKMN